LARHHVPLIADDIYGDICFGTEGPKPFIVLDRPRQHNLLQLILEDGRSWLSHRLGRSL
jgi:hypothetical protein